MRVITILAVLLIGCGVVASAGAPDNHVFVPMASSYLNGDFVGISQVGDPETDMGRCMGTLQHVIGATMENNTLPMGGMVEGACVPVHIHPEAKGR